MISNVTSPSFATGTSATSSTVSGGGAMGKDEFLKLFVAQIRHQDPMNPMQGDQLAAQLAQFSSVEQLINLNAQMEAQASSNASMLDALHTTSAMGMLGKTVTIEGDGVVIDANGKGSVSAEIGRSGGNAILHIYDTNGDEVGTRSLGNITGGRKTFEVGSAAEGLDAGAYTYSIEVTDGTETAVPVTTFVTGRIDGIQSSANGPVLTSGPFVFPFGSIVEIGDGSGSSTND